MTDVATALGIVSRLDANEFENWLAVYFQDVYGLDRAPQRYGVSGQSQSGVDLIFRNSGGALIGVQAKAYHKKPLTTSAIDAELTLARAFEPKLDRYIICTTRPRKAQLQSYVLGLTLHDAPAVELLAAEDLAEDAVRHPRALGELLKNLGGSVLAAISAMVGAPRTQALAMTDRDPDLDGRLRVVEGWIDAGDPARALGELARHQGSVDERAWLRLRIRAQFALQKYDAVVDEAHCQSALDHPDPVLLGHGAHAAEILGDPEQADVWMDRALAIASGATRNHVVASYIRLHAERRDRTAAELEEFAENRLGDGVPVALAIADAAFTLGDLDRAVHWYATARARQPQWPASAQGNALSATLWQHLEAWERGTVDMAALRAITSELATFADTVTAPGLRLPLLLNLGFAWRVLRDTADAARVWDAVLDSDHGNEDLWLRRCILSAADGAGLPSDAAAARWAVTPIARLALASACNAHGEWAQATALIAAAEADPAATENDRVLAQLERITTETQNDDGNVTSAHVTTILALGQRSAPSPAVFIWLVENYEATAGDDTSAVRDYLLATAGKLEPDPIRRLAMGESLIRANLDDVAAAWLSEFNAIARGPGGTIAHVRAAMLALRICARTFRFAEMHRYIEELRPLATDHADVALHCGHALAEVGERGAAYEFFTAAIQAGQLHPSLLLGWARLAGVVNRRREARRLMATLAITPSTAGDYASLLQVRSLLGLHGQAMAFTPETRALPETASTIFGASLQAQAVSRLPVAYGRVVHVHIARDGTILLDEPILLAESADLSVPGTRLLTPSHYPWISELLGAVAGEARALNNAPFTGATATVVDVFDAARWGFRQARELLRLLPEHQTGVQAFTGTPAEFHLKASALLAQTSAAVEHQVMTAIQWNLSIAATAGLLKISPRLLLRTHGGWRPSGHEGTGEAIGEDERALATGARLVLDPTSLLLLLDLGAEAILASLPEKAIMTPQAVTQLFDWWYAFERTTRGTRGYMALGKDGTVSHVPITAAYRVAVTGFWRRVRDVVMQHVEVIAPDVLTNVHLQRLAPMLGPPVVSGIALAAQNDWVYVTEENMVRGVARISGGAQTASVHRLAISAANAQHWRRKDALLLLAALINRGWKWVGFPGVWLKHALKLPADVRWRVATPLLGNLRHAEPLSAINALVGVLHELDAGRLPGVEPRRLRAEVLKALPRPLSREHRILLEGQIHTLQGRGLAKRSYRTIHAWAMEDSP